MSNLPPEGTSYKKKAASLWKRFCSENAMPHIPMDDADSTSLGRFVDWLVNVHRHRVSKPSWRLYRYAVSYCLKEHDLAARLNVPGTLSKKDAGKRSTNSRQKRLDLNETATLVNWLRAHRGRWSTVATLWLQSTLLTGLRPIEWSATHLFYHRGAPMLAVETAKQHRTEETTSTMRYIPLSHLDEYETEIITKQITAASAFAEGGQFEKAYQGVRNLLYRATIACFPNSKQSIDLYSARHEFAANLKASSISDAALAYLMGHKTESTARNFYGRRKQKLERNIAPNLHVLEGLIADDLLSAISTSQEEPKSV